MIPQKEIKIEAYDYELPEERIAFFPKAQRDTSKLLVYHRDNKEIEDSTFAQLPSYLDANTMLVFNDSKVIHARLLVKNSTGASIEIFCLEPIFPSRELTQALGETGSVTWKCFVGNAKRWKTPIAITFEVAGCPITITATKGEQVENAFLVTFESDRTDVSFAEWVEAYGKMPLPPYIKREAEKEDEKRYQTVYAHYDGSVAAPTAGLHFSQELLQSLQSKNVNLQYVTLHVGAGTFKPVTSEEIGDHYMHNEQIIITQNFIRNLLQNSEQKIIAVGTTVTRTLESVFIIGAKLHHHLPDPWHVNQWEYYENENIRNTEVKTALAAILKDLQDNDLEYRTATTQLMIVPSYQFKLMQGIITNFHQPKSTLLLLITAFLGDSWRDIYQHAIQSDYRFLSYGDANLYL